MQNNLNINHSNKREHNLEEGAEDADMNAGPDALENQNQIGQPNGGGPVDIGQGDAEDGEIPLIDRIEEENQPQPIPAQPQQDIQALIDDINLNQPLLNNDQEPAPVAGAANGARVQDNDNVAAQAP